MNEARRRLERELRRAEDNERAMRRLVAELDDETADVNARFEPLGMEPIAPFAVTEPKRVTPAALRRVSMIRA